MTKKDYEEIAKTFFDEKLLLLTAVGKFPKGPDVCYAQLLPESTTLQIQGLCRMASALASTFEANNPRFDRARFMTACGF